MSQTSEHWGILGGGILGMTLARELARNGKQVTLCEAAPQVGGLASAWQLGSVTWDRHYHVTLLSDTSIRGILRDLGLEQEMQWKPVRTGFFVDGAFHPMTTAIDFLRFPPLGLIDKFRLGATVLYGSRVKNWKKLEQVAVSDWLTTWSGRNTFQRVWRPLLEAKLGDSYQRASAAFIWATIARLYAARRSGMKQELFGYVPGGYARILARYYESLEADGVEIRANAGARAVRSMPDGRVQVDFANGQQSEFNRVILTMAAPVAASLCGQLSDEEKGLLNGIQYQGVICASLLLKKKLNGYYVTNITDKRVPFTGVIEMSALVDSEQFGGHSLVYLPKYVAPTDPAFQKTDEELKDFFLGGLRIMYPSISADDVAAFRVSRAKHVFAIPTIGYSGRLPPVRTSIPGVYILNSAHIVNGTLNVNETVNLARASMEKLI